MKLLLDTHAFIWWDSEPSKLPSQVLDACRNSNNQIVLSVASVWEMQIKLQLGKLHLKHSLAEIVQGQQQTNNLKILDVTLLHVLALERLPTHHKDPFDRILVSQTNVENATLVSKDKLFEKYSVRLLW